MRAVAAAGLRRGLSTMLDPKVRAPSMVYISGEEMTAYAMQLVRAKWVEPYFDTSAWEYYDLSCAARDKTDDKVLKDAVEAGSRIGAIFKEPTITPTAVQQKEMGLKKAWGSPNGAMRRGWNGITISRDTIHIDGMELGFKEPVLFERHAVGGEYGAGWKQVGKGRLVTKFYPNDKYGEAVTVDERYLDDEHNVAVVYHNPYDNVTDLARHFFSRCLKAGITPYVVTKKTVFKWQEGFWQIMKSVFDAEFKPQFNQRGLLARSNGELPHLISDAATMQIIRWTQGGFGMAAHNYDGDMLTDEIAQVHRSPGFITSNLIGKRSDGVPIMEFEASHGTVADLWHAHQRGEETSFNPLGMAEALIGAMRHAADLDSANKVFVHHYTSMLRQAMHRTMVYGQGTRDLCGPDGLTTEEFIDKVAWRLDRYLKMGKAEAEEARTAPVRPNRKYRRNYAVVDEDAIAAMFKSYDTDGSGTIDLAEFTDMIVKLGVAPKKEGAEGAAEGK
ncbi:hypothetical protein KFE25_001301 [Diacronema lutheri]|uniref:EF-hand domain-containing protein n=2 Tax=Diacronema lutheri TaxID=2081491 RepID=A0A8J5XDC9_DIALT|nr:hypothetical protein KFE25_001301 [Diacronema lutheri]